MDREITCRGNTLVTCVRLSGGRVDEAWSTGRMARNMDVLLRGGLDDQGRPQFVQQAHCICNDVHALAAVRALEDLAGVTVPRNALLVRSMVQALRCIQEHLLHVYQFHLSDWARLEAALRADPNRAAGLDRRSDEGAGYYRQAQEQLRALAQGDGAEAFANQAGDHPDFHGPDEFHLLLHAHGLEALQAGAVLNAALDLLGGGAGAHAAYQVGGLSKDMDLGPAVLQQLRGLLALCRDFVRQTFAPDLEQLARVYAHWADLGAGGSFLAWGDFARPNGQGPLFPGGMVDLGGDGSLEVRSARPELVSEDKEPGWSPEDADRYRLRLGGQGPSFLWGQGEFVWLPASRHGGEPCEVGSLARVLAAWSHGISPVRQAVTDSLGAWGLSLATMNSTLGRILSRGVESVVLAQASLDWLDELETALDSGDHQMRTDWSLPASGTGQGLVEVARGSLTHTIQLEGNQIVRHDYLIPSLWNFSPRDSGGRGPLEQALLGTPVADPDRPLEILRTVHALDPCNACHVVVED